MTSPRLMLCRITSSAPPVGPLGLVGTFALPEFGVGYESRITITGGGATLSLLKLGALPLGLVASIDVGTRELVIAGTPLERGTYAFTLTVSDEYLQSASIVVGWTIAAPAFVLTGTLDAAVQDEAYSSGLTPVHAVGAVTWSISIGTLPAGLTINASSGLITGTPTENGTFNITVLGVDSIGQPATSAQVLEVSFVCDPHWSSRSALLHCDGANGSTTIVDETGKTWTAVGTSGGPAALSTAWSKFGSASLLVPINNQNHGILSPVSSDFTFGTGDFEVEFWFRTTSLANFGTSVMFDTRATAGSIGPVIYRNGADLRLYANLGVRIQSVFTLAINTDYCICLSRVAGVTRLRVNGTQVGSNYTDANNYNDSRVSFGYQYRDNVASCLGYYDEIRVTKGRAERTANYTPDTSPFIDVACP